MGSCVNSCSVVRGQLSAYYIRVIRQVRSQCVHLGTGVGIYHQQSGYWSLFMYIVMNNEWNYETLTSDYDCLVLCACYHQASYITTVSISDRLVHKTYNQTQTK